MLGLLLSLAVATPPHVAVAAAADLRYAMEDVSKALAGKVVLDVTYGSSGQFHAQLTQKAPFDVFLSADAAYPRRLVADGLAKEADVFPYARGALAVWVPADSTLHPEKDGLAALVGARRISIANPRHAPYGRAAEAALRATRTYERVQDRLVMADNAAQAAQMAHQGATDAAITALSLLQVPSMTSAGRSWRVPADLYAPVEQAGIILPWAKERAAAETVRAFLTGPEGRAILARHGFAPPGG
ncbi:MAG: molybdate ABC transporter substrate-binding protein [Deltaproteobacteria bacterium]|nr:molybdate ABC transporter substrate-binding protein [Deltaproteobacteria bacterium]